AFSSMVNWPDAVSVWMMSPLGVMLTAPALGAAGAAGAGAAEGAAGCARTGVLRAAVRAAATINVDSFINLTSQDTAPAGARRGVISDLECGAGQSLSAANPQFGRQFPAGLVNLPAWDNG